MPLLDRNSELESSLLFTPKKAVVCGPINSTFTKLATARYQGCPWLCLFHGLLEELRGVWILSMLGWSVALLLNDGSGPLHQRIAISLQRLVLIGCFWTRYQPSSALFNLIDRSCDLLPRGYPLRIVAITALRSHDVEHAQQIKIFQISPNAILQEYGWQILCLYFIGFLNRLYEYYHTHIHTCSMHVRAYVHAHTHMQTTHISPFGTFLVIGMTNRHGQEGRGRRDKCPFIFQYASIFRDWWKIIRWGSKCWGIIDD